LLRVAIIAAVPPLAAARRRSGVEQKLVRRSLSQHGRCNK
jgi:hypothetical protein